MVDTNLYFDRVTCWCVLQIHIYTVKDLLLQTQMKQIRDLNAKLEAFDIN